ncbi:phage tail sheath family protein [Alkalicoccobacillus gibsonii]|uniref:phage tail sheath family protein n=1 Tax=Alkalicoccobacillus gibsonii TaxID=79881 RepID=UPI001932D97F|nr:phage tail sheath family protein [Alkalicoccobacillus gibsonii]MBM0064929.1 phage tail sheath family protein [Alkalicoccobacillus gibsonii]
MNGGTFQPGVEKTRPGIYTRFTEKAQTRISGSDRGRAALPVILSWGVPNKIIEVSSDADAINKLGVSLSDPSMFLVREAKKRSNTVLVYRLNDGQKATGSIGPDSSVSAIYGGKKGESIMIRVSPNVLDSELFDVETFFDEAQVERQTVASAADLQSNAYVEFRGTGSLDPTVGIYLQGGSDGVVTPQAYAGFLSALETESFNTVAFPVADEALKVTAASFIRRMREDVGIKVQGVIADYDGSYEGIINVTSSVQLDAGRVLTNPEATAWVAGATAGASTLQALTSVVYEGAADVSVRLDNAEIIKRLKNGEFIFTFDPSDRTVSVEQDLNSAAKGKFAKNKIVRIIDAINNDLRSGIKAIILQAKQGGADIPGNEDGESIIRTGIVQYMNELQAAGAIQNFDPEEDVVVSLMSGDSVMVKIAVQPVDSVEKVYLDVEVS